MVIFSTDNTHEYATFYLSLLVLILAKLSIVPLFEKSTFGLASNPIKLAIVPSQEAGKVIASAERLIAYLQKTTGYAFATSMPVNYIVAMTWKHWCIEAHSYTDHLLFAIRSIDIISIL